MKTQTKTFMKVLGMVALALSLVSCGKDNSSGGSSSSFGAFGSQNLNAATNQYINTTISQQAQSCQSQGGVVREFVQQVNVQGQGIAIGVTSNGGAAILDAQTRALRFRLCDDPMNPFAGQPQIVSTGYISQTQCQGLYILNGLSVKIMTRAGVPYDFIFRNPYQQCGNNQNPPFNNGW